MMTLPNLLLIAGTGTKAGKTSMVCRIIEEFSNLDIISVKITPHFHETTEGLVTLSENEGYAIYEETNRNTFKDTSRMLKAGAGRVFFAKVWDDQLLDVFLEIIKDVDPFQPVICESPALRNFIEPGVFIIMTSDTINKHKDISHLQSLPHVFIKFEELAKMKSLPIIFEDGRWLYS